MTRKAFIVPGLAYGDEGKGAMVDYLCRAERADTVVRFNGGAQAGHNVCMPARWPGGPGGAPVFTHHEFRQFGSGSLVPGVRTHLSQYHLVDPEWIFHEADELAKHTGRNVWGNGLLFIDRRANVVTPFHRAANRIREESRGVGRHGSVGMGIWETESDKRAGLGLTMDDIEGMTNSALEEILVGIQARKRQETYDLWGKIPLQDGNPNARVLLDVKEIPMIAENMKILAEVARLTEGLPDDAETLVFEGAQGVLLDEKFGWHPFTTGSKTTSQNARVILADAGFTADEVTQIGCLRTYGTRHGAGPFVGEEDSFNFSEPYNRTGQWQGGWRQGFLDLVALRYAIDCDPDVDGIALSHMDRIVELGVDEWPCVVEYGSFNPAPIPPADRDQQAYLTQCMWAAYPVVEYIPVCDLLDEIFYRAGRKVTYVAEGPSHEDRSPVSLHAKVAA